MPWQKVAGGYTTKDRGGFVRNPGQYEKLRAKGMSKERAARIVNKGDTMVESPLRDSAFVIISKGDNWKQQMHNSNTTSYVGQPGISGAERKSRLKRNFKVAGTSAASELAGAAPGAAFGIHALRRGKLKAAAVGGGAALAGGIAGGVAGTKYQTKRQYPGYTMGVVGLKRRS